MQLSRRGSRWRNEKERNAVSPGCQRLGCKCNASRGLRGLRQFDPDDKRAAARFPFIGTPDIRSRKTPEDQQGDEFMAVS